MGQEHTSYDLRQFNYVILCIHALLNNTNSTAYFVILGMNQSTTFRSSTIKYPTLGDLNYIASRRSINKKKEANFNGTLSCFSLNDSVRDQRIEWFYKLFTIEHFGPAE